MPKNTFKPAETNEEATKITNPGKPVAELVVPEYVAPAVIPALNPERPLAKVHELKYKDPGTAPATRKKPWME
jgi:hypothetical protein